MAEMRVSMRDRMGKRSPKEELLGATAGDSPTPHDQVPAAAEQISEPVPAAVQEAEQANVPGPAEVAAVTVQNVEPAQTPPPAPCLAQPSPLDTYEARMVAQYAQRRTIAVTGFVPAHVKARLTKIARAAEDALGSRGFTESAQVRALAEVIYELDTDWPKVLAGVDPADPVASLKTVFREQVVKAYLLSRHGA